MECLYTNLKKSYCIHLIILIVSHAIAQFALFAFLYIFVYSALINKHFQHLITCDSKPSKVVIRRAGDGDLWWWGDAGEGGLGPCCALIGHLPPLPASHWSSLPWWVWGQQLVNSRLSTISRVVPCSIIRHNGGGGRKQILIESPIWVTRGDLQTISTNTRPTCHKPHTWR